MNPPQSDAEWENALGWVLRCPDLEAVADLLCSPEWRTWSTDPARVTDPGDDAVPGLGLSKWWLVHGSRYEVIAFWHDLMYRRTTAPFYHQRDVDRRFYDLCCLRRFYRDRTGLALAKLYYALLRTLGRGAYEGPRN